MPQQFWWVYILLCSDGTLYTGATNHLTARIEKHNQGKGARYTRSRLPVELVYVEEAEDKSAALKREAQIKKLKRKQKIVLVEVRAGESK